MISGVTESGFKYSIDKDNLDNYELIECIAGLDDNPLLLPKVLKLILGEDQVKKLKDHLRTEKGIVSNKSIQKEIEDILKGSNETKN